MPERTVHSLGELRARGLGLVVSSNNGQPAVDEFVRREGFPFDLAFGFDAETGFEKGRPHVERVLDHFAVPSVRLWYVGDSLNDGHLARACGVRFLGRVGTFPRAAFHERFPDVVSILEIEEVGALLDAVG